MENIFISFLLIEILFTTILIINCAIDELLPIKEYKKWSHINELKLHDNVDVEFEILAEEFKR